MGAVLLLWIGVVISRKSKSQPNSQNTNRLRESEKDVPEIKSESRSAITDLAKPSSRIVSRPPQPPPFTPPMLDQSSEMNWEMNSEMPFSSFEAYGPALDMPPRRRSYTKTTTAGTEVSGEIIVAEGWRRHTRVFGGGVCKACEESERSMSA